MVPSCVGRSYIGEKHDFIRFDSILRFDLIRFFASARLSQTEPHPNPNPNPLLKMEPDPNPNPNPLLQMEPCEALAAQLVKKSSKSLSGVLVITVLTSPFPKVG